MIVEGAKCSGSTYSALIGFHVHLTRILDRIWRHIILNGGQKRNDGNDEDNGSDDDSNEGESKMTQNGRLREQ